MMWLLRLRRRVATAAAIVIALGVVAIDASRGQELPATAPPVRYVPVPADDPATWPAGDWLPIARDDYRRLRMGTAATQPHAAFLEQATYRARFVRDSLRGGTLEAVGRLRTDEPQWVDLGDSSLAIHELRWPEGEAVWGTAGTGQKLLRIEGDRQTLTGRWSLAGQSVFAAVEFNVVVPPAVVSRLELEVPDSHTVESEGALVASATSAGQSAWTRWSIDLGQRTSCRLRIVRKTSEEDPGLLDLQASHLAKYTLRADTLQLQTDVTLLDVPAALNTLEFTAPEKMIVSSITVSGDVTLPAERVQEQKVSVIRVDVSGVTLGRGSTIRLRSEMPFRPGRSRVLPRLGLRKARWLSVRKEIVVARPLQLKDFQAEGAHLINSSMGSNTGDSLELEDIVRRSPVAVTVDSPRPDLRADILSVVQWRDRDPLLQSTIRLEALSGSTYGIECVVPSEWEVTRVESSSSAPVAQWQTEWDEVDDQRRLMVELANALTPQRPTEIIIWARPRSTLQSAQMRVPVVLPLISGRRFVQVAISTPPGVTLTLPGDSAYAAVERETMQASWEAALSAAFGNETDKGLVLLQATDPADNQSLGVTFASSPQPGAEAATIATPASTVNDATVREYSNLIPPPVVLADVTVETTVAVVGGGICRNRAVIHFPAVSDAPRIIVRLPSSATLLQAMPLGFPDDSPLRLLPINENSASIKLSSAEPTDVEMIYESPLRRSIIVGQAEIPLPEWDGQWRGIAWRMTLPEDFRLGAQTDGTSVSPTPTVSWSQRVFGPLGRSADSRVFWPFSRHFWRDLIAPVPERSAVPDEDTDGTASWRTIAASQTSLKIQFWSVSSAFRVGWIILLLSLLLAAWPHRPERLIRPAWMLRLVLVGIVGAFLAPEFLTIPWGGFIVGGALGAMLPDAWCIPRPRSIRESRRSDSQASTRIQLPLSASTGVVVLAAIMGTTALGWQSGTGDRAAAPTAIVDVLIPIDSQSPSAELPSVVYVTRETLGEWLHGEVVHPRTLLRSAEYEISEFDSDRPRMTATFEVFVTDPRKRARVAIPLTNVSLDGTDVCRVDGELAALLPLESGQGVVVEIPEIATPVEAPGDDEEDASGSKTATPRLAKIQIQCRPRPSSSVRPKLDVGIPTVLDSQLIFHAGGPQSPGIDVAHRGAIVPPSADGRWRVALGAISHVTAHPSADSPARRWLKPVLAASVVEVHSLRLQVETRLTFDVDLHWLRLGDPSLQLQLPPRSLLRSVRAPGLLRTQTDSTRRGPIHLHLTFGDITQTEVSVQISYDLPTNTGATEMDVTIPPLPFVANDAPAVVPMHLLGVSATPGFRIVAADPEGMVSGTTGIDESKLPDWRGGRRVRTAEATYRLEAPREIAIPLVAVVPQVSESSQQTLTVLPSRVGWSARLDAVVADSAVALHRLRIDPRISLHQVSVMQDNVNRSAAWSRLNPEEVVIFLSEELSGRQAVQLQGTFRPENRQDFELPEISIVGATERERPEMVIRHSEVLSVALESANGDIETINGGERELVDGVRVAGRVVIDVAENPLRLRVRQAEPELQVEQATLIRPAGEDTIHWSSRLQMTAAFPLDAPILVEVDSADVMVTVTPPVTVTRQFGDEKDFLSYLLSVPAETQTFEVTITGETPAAAPMLPMIRIPQGTLRRHVVLAPVDSVIDVRGEAATVVTVQQWPDWFLGQVPEAERAEWQGWTTAARIRIGTPGEPSATLVLNRLDTAIWHRPDGGWDGVTVANVIARQRGGIEFHLPEGVSLKAAILDEKPETSATGDSVSFSLSPGSKPRQCVMLWSHPRLGTSQSVVHMPVPVGVSNVRPTLTLFGQAERNYQFESDPEMIDPAVLLRRIDTGNESTALPSPVAEALRAAGVGRWPAAGDDETAAARSVLGLRLSNPAESLSIDSLDQHMVRLIGVLVVAVVVLLGWTVISQWGLLRRFVETASDRTWPRLMLFFAAVWLFGASLLGFLLLLAVVLIGLRHRRRSSHVTSATA